jgi:hypothetical protein
MREAWLLLVYSFLLWGGEDGVPNELSKGIVSR